MCPYSKDVEDLILTPLFIGEDLKERKFQCLVYQSFGDLLQNLQIQSKMVVGFKFAYKLPIVSVHRLEDEKKRKKSKSSIKSPTDDSLSESSSEGGKKKRKKEKKSSKRYSNGKEKKKNSKKSKK